MPRAQTRPATTAEANTAAVSAVLARADAGKILGLNDLPDEAADLVRQLLRDYAAGRRPRIIADDADVSTFEAANLLNISRPHLISLLDKGEIAYHRVGTHRRMKLADVLAYKDEKDSAADAAMDELVAEAQRLKLGY